MNKASESPEPRARKIGVGRLIAIIAVAVIALVLMLQNFSTVKVQILTIEMDLPLWLVMAGMFVLGMLLGGAARAGVRALRGAPRRD